MCGRYVILSTPAAIGAYFGYAEQPDFPPRYNVAPTQPIPVVRLHNGRRQFVLMRWGLIPAWVKDPRRFGPLINARAEMVSGKPAYRAAMARRRCLVPADGFYQWRQSGGRRQTYFVRRKSSGPPLAFAGLWETWTGPNGEELDGAAIVTTTASRALAAIGPRMPVILPPQAFDRWLDCATVDANRAAALLTAAPEELLEAVEVSAAVNRPGNDCQALIAPLPADKPAADNKTVNPDGQLALFEGWDPR